MTENNFTRHQWDSHEGDTLPNKTLDEAFSRVMQKASEAEKAQKQFAKASSRKHSRDLFRFVLTGVAAAVTLVAVPWITIKLYSEKVIVAESSAAPQPLLCQQITHNGETREVLLPDGSQVSLNAGSVLIYPEEFSSSRRQVFLSGEAVFSVTHSDSVPFVVNTSDMEISVHGTVFNVNAYPESSTTAATLCEGSISAKVAGADEEVYLVPNQRLSFDRESGISEVSAVSAAEDTAWLRGDMCFRSENIHSIARAIERKYGLATYVTSGKYDSMLLTAKFIHGESLPQMLRAVCALVPGMSFEITNDCVYIR